MKLSTPLEYVERALRLTRERRARAPAFPVYTVVIDQLEYIKSVFDGTEVDKSKLHRLTIGAIAAKEFETTDSELSEALMDVFFIAEQSANGLKIRLPE
jgi:hypothetical protein